MATITPFLWFNTDIQNVIDYYQSIFGDIKANNIRKGPDGGVFTAEFEIYGQKFMALNGGPPHFKFNESVSFFVSVETQDEVDNLWEKLTADGGEESMCGWLKDRYGLSWQIVPTALGKLLGDPDKERSNRAMQAMLKMRKLNIAELEKAANG